MQEAIDSGLILQPTYEVTKVLHAPPNQRKFKQDLRYQGLPLTLQTSPIPTDQIKIEENSFGKYICIPVDSWLRKQLDTIEEFVIANLFIPGVLGDGWKAINSTDTPYKPLSRNSHIILPISKWCSCKQEEANINISDIREGVLKVNITVLGLYYGPHKDNKLASLSMFAQSLIYIPKLPEIDTIFDELLKEGDTKQKAVKNVRRKRKKEDQ